MSNKGLHHLGKVRADIRKEQDRFLPTKRDDLPKKKNKKKRK